MNVGAKSGDVVGAGSPPTDSSGQGSYPAEMTADQSDWLHERAAERRRRWAEHVATLACDT